ncbi:MAG: Ig-like domain-containing protein [Methanomicrobiaceae archaeon]|nr:Ig-like domain-containing protein [Methanomicrobiaceae archaeon]
MKRKNLYIMIVAAVAIVIMAVLILTGAGQSGPLTGEMAIPTAGPTPPERPLPSTLTMSASDYCSKTFNNAFEYTLDGQLLREGGSGAPGAGRTIELYQWANYGQGYDWSKVATTTTEEDGSFSFTRSTFAGDTYQYQARFPGDEYYAASVSGEVEQTCLYETHLTLSFDDSTCHCNGEHCEGTLRGTLLSYGGVPLEGRTLEIYTESWREGEWLQYSPPATTQADGSFNYNLSFFAGAMYDVKVVFPGDTDNPAAETVLPDVHC